jgi:hypothetical protein
MNGWTDLNVGGQHFMMKNDQAYFRLHEQITTLQKWMH